MTFATWIGWKRSVRTRARYPSAARSPTCGCRAGSARQPVPIGVAGELYVGGDGLARGYFKRPELTAERFVADPFGPDAERYVPDRRSVRHLPDGGLEFLGRLDHQVKLRGYRIEPGEIEAVLVRDAGMREALVVLREDAPGDRRLVAYVVAGATAPVGADLRALLKTKLPDYMLPAAFVAIAGAAAHAQRQDRPRGAAGAGAGGRRARILVRSATRQHRELSGQDLAGAPPAAEGRRARQLLRPWRAFAAGGAADEAHRRHFQPTAAARHSVGRRWHDRGAGRRIA